MPTMSYVLSDAQVADQLSALPEWSGSSAEIRRDVTFGAYLTGIEAVRRVAEIAEAANHHPDIDIRWRRVTFVLSTHSAGGVTTADLEMARRIDEVLAG